MKKIHFLPQCQSTNDEAWKLVENEDFACNGLVYTHYQEAGRGQRGNLWHSEPGKNMLFSVLVRPAGLAATEMFAANKAVALACADALRSLCGLDVKIKWPNDLFIGGLKLGGILIETRISGADVEWIVAGIGINANQVDGLPPGATSLALELGRDVPVEAWLTDIGFAVADCVRSLPSPALETGYRKNLLFLGQNRRFFLEGGSHLEGSIRDVDGQGRLVIEDYAGKWHTFAHRSVTYFNPGA